MGAPHVPLEAGDPAPAWDLRVLDLPAVLVLPEAIEPPLDPLVGAAFEALLAVAAGRSDSHRQVGDLGRVGVVAIRTAEGVFEIHETLLGWALFRTEGTPDAYDLAEAARVRARRLARRRRGGGTVGGP